MRVIFPFFIFLAASFSAGAQLADSSDIAYGQAVLFYHQSLSPETNLYNGNEYVEYAYSIQEGTPFFDPVPFANGSVIYYQTRYENVSIAYDIVKSEVVIYDAAHLYKLVLHKNGVSSFSTSGCRFVHLTKDSAGAKDMNAGYYEVLYDGKTKVLKRQTRSVQESLAGNGLSKKFIVGSSDYFIWKDSTYHEVNSKGALFSLLGKGNELQHWLKKKKLKFSRDKDNSLAQSAIWYDTVAP